MELLRHVLDADPATPRLTVYNETDGSRLDFSAITLDNWAAKVANMLIEEFDLDVGSNVGISLPGSWQAVAITLGALAAQMDISFGADTYSDCEVLFCPLNEIPSDAPDDVALVTSDPFGRGVAELGLELPEGAVDFGPTVRFYGDQFYGRTPSLTELFPTAAEPERVLTTSIASWENLKEGVLLPLAAGGSAVVVTGLVDTNRLTHIVETEKVDRMLT